MTRMIRFLWVATGTALIGYFFWKQNLPALHISWLSTVVGLVVWESILYWQEETYISFSSLAVILWTIFVYIIYGEPWLKGLSQAFTANRDIYRFLVILTLFFFGIWLLRNSRLFSLISSRSWRPYVVISGSFGVLIITGGFLLLFPFSSHGISVIDAFFTATSAVCVTGLTVVDTATSFSLFGQGVILLLIQLGGLGLMVFAGAFTFLLGQGLSLQRGNLLANAIGTSSFRDIRNLIKSILLFTLGWEMIGAMLLFISFLKKMPWYQALYYSVFHSVSAFCNAGFSLFPDNLMGFREKPLVIHTIAMLIILGGMGFIVMRNIWQIIKRKVFHQGTQPTYLKLHTRIVLMMTSVLIVGGTIAFYFLERNNQLSGLSLPLQWMNAFFAAVTPRTAGFNTIDYGSVKPATLFLTMILMFIGASPGSTGGGIKTTVAFLILVNTYYVLRELLLVTVWKREIPFENIRKAHLIFFMSLLWVLTIFGIVLITEPLIPFEKLLFEVISAFGTVGLSTGITPQLSTTTKLLLIITMFFGRVGPLTLFYGFISSSKKAISRYPHEDVIVG